ncbi:arylsulfatase [Zobellia sp.]|nr:arylsulfatase [Zobellia sp.]
MISKLIQIILLVFLVSCNSIDTDISTESTAPNILIIVADDMGYSDISYHGGEIETPYLDTFFEQSTRLNQFYVSPSCSPTRAMLLSGADSHTVGLGNMMETLLPWQIDQKGYEGYLRKEVVTFADVLKENGYHTYMTGKWHMGTEIDQTPDKRGFERSYAMLLGASMHNGDLWDVPPSIRDLVPPHTNHREDGELVYFPEKSFSSNFYTEKLLEYIDKNKSDQKPFAGYLALTAPHWPLQAPKSYVLKYKGKYAEGYEVIRKRRFEKAKELGLIPKNTNLLEIEGLKPWENLSVQEQQEEARRMEVYAAMVHNMDANIGRVINYLKRNNLYNNTMILFFSDNGPDAGYMERAMKDYGFNNSLENMGKADSFLSIGKGWGAVSAVPFRGKKGKGFEGGIRGLAAIKPPFATTVNETQALLHVMDVFPSLLDLADITISKSDSLQAISGKSFIPVLKNQVKEIRAGEPFGIELINEIPTKVLRKDDFKLVWINPTTASKADQGKWELYNIIEDPTESNNLSLKMPEKFAELIEDYKSYQKNNGVITNEL